MLRFGGAFADVSLNVHSTDCGNSPAKKGDR